MTDWDETKPDGSVNISLGDDAIREQLLVVRERLEIEHYFPDNANTNRRGRHKFGVGGTAARSAAMPTPAVGNVWFNTTSQQWNVYSGGQWRQVGAAVGDIKMCSRAIEIDVDGWLVCDGRELSQATYSLLYNTCLSYFDDNGVDPAPAAGNFRIPRFAQRAPIGRLAGDPLYQRVGLYGGEEEHTLTIAEMPAHDHGGVTGSTNVYNTATGARDPSGAGSHVGVGGHTHTIPSQGGGGAHNNMPPFLVVGFLIFTGVY